ncbi:cbb3-type cytochrome oxidase assembly protein CcoS [Paraperlucidibaca wandonensis]|jgi:cbb3-type cytochrome oxidase maturation protein|uniref:Cbb3-type cytochrome oxidase assembly protein CcoS n=1 Tax=Paraperlucidibaca wandonensis TaxID=1268273 RepID=A0ABW3HC91_9GAMM|nr:cbb3-type cytochrome oxidase assembly protein CcoS [Paraperlucidibaca sp.]MBQ0723422.1 cbb3-type cytochrome oxidase assembly protein CcoS [Paraperlucidibaca sp.]MBQ0842192.1 cbb3-type cytochrome oxidase assembly protein CcoS [Paraperlucidibaca sp.]|tara:strand:+ start:791 stop:1021 length:231 start_codon:yes stop_codon:yes gene_type:complete
MEVIYLLVPLSLAFISIGIYVFFWAIKSEQFDDMEGPAHRILMDDQSQRRRDLAAQEQRHAERAAQAAKAKDTGND